MADRTVIPTAGYWHIGSRLRFELAIAGWAGAAGLVLAIVGAVVQFALVPQQEQATKSARLRAEALHRELLGGIDKRNGAGVGDSLTRFRDRLTAEPSADDALQVIQDHIRSRGLQVGSADYKWQRNPAARLTEVHVGMPLKGSYAALRGFLGDVLRELPGLALEQCDLQRDTIGTTTVEARLRFTLFLRAGA